MTTTWQWYLQEPDTSNIKKKYFPTHTKVFVGDFTNTLNPKSSWDC
jgi:hypothetical protein